VVSVTRKTLTGVHFLWRPIEPSTSRIQRVLSWEQYVAFTPISPFQFAIFQPISYHFRKHTDKETIKELQVLLEGTSEALHSRLCNLRGKPGVRCASAHMH
jgi:hypothetical protein